MTLISELNWKRTAVLTTEAKREDSGEKALAKMGSSSISSRNMTANHLFMLQSEVERFGEGSGFPSDPTHYLGIQCNGTLLVITRQVLLVDKVIVQDGLETGVRYEGNGSGACRSKDARGDTRTACVLCHATMSWKSSWLVAQPNQRREGHRYREMGRLPHIRAECQWPNWNETPGLLTPCTGQ